MRSATANSHTTDSITSGARLSMVSMQSISTQCTNASRCLVSCAPSAPPNYRCLPRFSRPRTSLPHKPQHTNCHLKPKQMHQLPSMAPNRLQIESNSSPFHVESSRVELLSMAPDCPRLQWTHDLMPSTGGCAKLTLRLLMLRPLRLVGPAWHRGLQGRR